MQSVVICVSCVGEGQKIGYKEGSFEEEVLKCDICKGTGRMIKQEFSILHPFNTDSSIISGIDRDVHNILREYREL